MLASITLLAEPRLAYLLTSSFGLTYLTTYGIPELHEAESAECS